MKKGKSAQADTKEKNFVLRKIVFCVRHYIKIFSTSFGVAKYVRLRALY